MTSPTWNELMKDRLALSVARALALANVAVASHGIDPGDALVTISEEAAPPDRLWRIHYGPRDYLHRRGGDVTVLVHDRTGVQRVLLGQ
jgi:hypothetical protein